jgi:hypothetical protein
MAAAVASAPSHGGDGPSSRAAALSELTQSIAGARYNTTLMLSRLQRFEERLGSIDNKMRPIQITTENYSKAKGNISSTLEEVSKTYEYFRIAADVKVIINQGYKPATQKQFFDALGRLSQAKKFFEDHREIKSSMTVLMTIDTLLRNAVMQCVAELERLLVPLGKTVEPEDGKEVGKYRVINPMPSAVAAELKTLFALFDKHNQRIHFEVFQGIRIAQVRAELQVEEEAHAKEWAALLDDVPYIKGSHPLQGYITLAYEMLRGELQLWSNALNPSNPQAIKVFAAICDATVMEIQRLLTPMLIDDEEHTSSNFIIRQANSFLIRLEMLDMFMARYDDMLEICRPEPGKSSTASVALTALRNAMVEACVDSINILLQSSSDPGDHIDLATHEEFKKAYKKGEVIAVTNPGESCDLHPITGNVLHCCKELAAFEPVYRRMCELVSEIGVHNNFPYMYASELQDLVTSLVDNLFDSLQQRADRYNVVVPPTAKPQTKEQFEGAVTRALNVKQSKLFDAGAKEAQIAICHARRHLFLANNLYSLYIYCRDMQRAQVAALHAGEGTSGMVVLNDLARFLNSVEEQLHEAQKQFVESIVGALGLLENDLEEFAEQRDALQKRGDKRGLERLLKAKFSVFNSGMDALLAQQGEWRVTSVDLREHIGANLADKVCPVWTTFFNRNSSTAFSKKHQKEYLRNPPHDVTMILSHFFG